MASIELVATRLLAAGAGSQGLVSAGRRVAAQGRLAPVVMAGG